MANESLKSIIEKLNSQTEMLSGENISVGLKSGSLIKKACQISYEILKDFDLFCEDATKKNSKLEKYLITSKKEIAQKNQTYLKNAVDYANGKLKTDVCMCVSLSENDIKTQSQDYLNFTSSLISAVENNTEIKAKDECLTALYELKSDLTTVEHHLQNYANKIIDNL
jgi:hypothetical protein